MYARTLCMPVDNTPTLGCIGHSTLGHRDCKSDTSLVDVLYYYIYTYVYMYYICITYICITYILHIYVHT